MRKRVSLNSSVLDGALLTCVRTRAQRNIKAGIPEAYTETITFPVLSSGSRWQVGGERAVEEWFRTWGGGRESRSRLGQESFCSMVSCTRPSRSSFKDGETHRRPARMPRGKNPARSTGNRILFLPLWIFSIRALIRMKIIDERSVFSHLAPKVESWKEEKMICNVQIIFYWDLMNVGDQKKKGATEIEVTAAPQWMRSIRECNNDNNHACSFAAAMKFIRRVCGRGRGASRVNHVRIPRAFYRLLDLIGICRRRS